MTRSMSLAATVLLSTMLGAAAGAETISFDSERWEIAAHESRLEEHLGRPSLYLRGGLAWIQDEAFVDGIVEFDVAFTGERGFLGGVWRLQDAYNYEELYLRPHQSGHPDANQYTPAFYGMTAWQLYHGEGYGAPVVYPFDKWIHVKIVFSGSRGEAYIDSDDPVLSMHELKRDVQPGKVGVACANFAGAHFSNFRYQRLERPRLESPPREVEPAPAGTVLSWQVSGTFAETSLDGKHVLTDADKAGLSWQTLAAESTGITNLSRLQAVTPDADTAFARLVVHSDRELVKKLSFGYSDRVKVYVNDRLVYAGSNDYRSRDYRYLGTIGLFDAIYLPLRPGRNEVWLAVSESFGGWGVLARFEDLDGLRPEPSD